MTQLAEVEQDDNGAIDVELCVAERLDADDQRHRLDHDRRTHQEDERSRRPSATEETQNRAVSLRKDRRMNETAVPTTVLVTAEGWFGWFGYKQMSK